MTTDQAIQLPEYYMAFSLGPLEIGLILVFVLILFGPKRLPGLGKSLGEAIRGFKRGISEDTETLDVTDSVKKEKLKKEHQD